ncbi:MAG: hypothetical protein QOF57_2187 [Frankiaceae bacterium]|jgi:hypothetical protein|nr:hypothetical protein [Frankiaceae bacterium]
MNDIRDAFHVSLQNEPPLRATRDDVLRGGRTRQRRQTVLASVAGIGVATLAVAGVLTVSHVAPTPAGGTQGAAATDTSADPAPTASEPTATSTDAPTPTSTDAPPAAPGLDAAHIAKVTANHKAKLAAITGSLKTKLEARGYVVAPEGGDDSTLRMSPTGVYELKLVVTKDGEHGVLIVGSQSSAGGEAAPTACEADLYACSVVSTAGGGTALFSSDNRQSQGAYGRHVAVWWSGVLTQAQYLNRPADFTLKVSDGLLLSLATDPSLDLGDVMTFTPDEVASFNLPSPTSPPTISSPEATTG